MNFSLVAPTDSEYHRIMMKRHLDQRRKHDSDSIPLPSQPRPHPLAPQLTRNNFSLPSLNIPPQRKRKTLNEENEKMKKYYRDQIEESLMDLQKKKAI